MSGAVPDLSITVKSEPAPCNVIPLEIVTVVDHVNVPAGSVIVSPFCASLSWIYWTLAAEPSDGQTFASQCEPRKTPKNRATKNVPVPFIIAAYRQSPRF